MDPDAVTFAFVMIVCVLSLGALAAIGTWTFRAFRHPRDPERFAQPNYDERFAQLQQSVDAIAVEVERIAEGQRFSTKLLADGARVPAGVEER
jgi:hypothetical protein